MKITDTHLFFWDTIYSQWFGFENKYMFVDNGKHFFTAEHYMMYHKAGVFGDEETQKQILNVNCPRTVKALGRSIKNFSDEVWDKHKFDIVVRGNYLKFSQNEDLLEIMNNHKHLILVEASPVDKIWGIGLHYSDKKCLDESQWCGQNLLGKAIMEARNMLCLQ